MRMFQEVSPNHIVQSTEVAAITFEETCLKDYDRVVFRMKTGSDFCVRIPKDQFEEYKKAIQMKFETVFKLQ